MLNRLHRLPRPSHPQSLRIIHSFLLSQLSLWPNLSRSSPPGIFSTSILSLSLSLFLVFFYWVFLLSCDSLFWIWLGLRFLFATIQIQFDDGVCLFRLNILWFCFFLLTGFGLAQILKWIWTVLETYEVNLIKFFFKSQVSLGSNFFYLFWWHLATFNSINPHQDNGLLLTRYDFSNWLDLWGQCISSYMFQWWHFFFLDIAFLYWCHWLEFSYANDRNSHFGQDRTRARMDRYKTKVGFHGLVDVLIT